MEKTLTRRALLVRAVEVPVGVGLGLGLTACGGDGGDTLVCADPSKLTSAEESVRRTLNYAETSPQAGKVCLDCDFFAPVPGSECGTCEIYGGGPVNPGGYCDSWS